MKRPRLCALATCVAAAILLSGPISAYGQTGAAPKPASLSGASTKKQESKPQVRSGPHVYLLRGLLNIFSLGMDDLADKLTRRGIYATVHNHAEWESLANEIARNYKAGNRSAVILVGHSLGADAVMMMGSYLDKLGVPVSLIVPFDGTASYAATKNVARVMNLTQRDYARMTRGPGFRGELQNIDVSGDSSIDHISIDKSARLHNMVINKILGVTGRGGGTPRPAASSASPDKPAPSESSASAQTQGTSSATR